MVKILIVDDDPTVRASVAKQLFREGFEVNTAQDGAEAIEIFKQNGADLVLMDIKMPGPDGFEVCETLKQHVDVPVIFLTGVMDGIIKQHMPNLVKAVNGAAFLCKPFDYSVLIELINNTLNEEKQQPEKS